RWRSSRCEPQSNQNRSSTSSRRQFGEVQRSRILKPSWQTISTRDTWTPKQQQCAAFTNMTLSEYLQDSRSTVSAVFLMRSSSVCSARSPRTSDKLVRVLTFHVKHRDRTPAAVERRASVLTFHETSAPSDRPKLAKTASEPQHPVLMWPSLRQYSASNNGQDHRHRQPERRSRQDYNSRQSRRLHSKDGSFRSTGG